MTRRAVVLPALSLLAALAGFSAYSVANDPPRRLILVSFDGAGGLDYAGRRTNGSLSPDGFLKAEREGFSAERLRVVTPSLTAVSHASIITGRSPAQTGIVSNTFRLATAGGRSRASGFDVEPAVETLWEALARQGRRVASLSWPGANQRSPRTRTGVGLRFTDTTTAGTMQRLDASGFTDALVALPLGVRSFSPPRQATIQIEEREWRDRTKTRPPFTLLTVAIDTVDDGRRAYDTLVFPAADGTLRARARPGEWFSTESRRAEDEGDEDVLLGRWNKVLELAPDLSAVTLYVGVEGRNRANPRDFRKTLDLRAGFWPGPPDPLFLDQQVPDTKSFVEQAERFSRFFVKAYEIAEQRGDWDVLLAYQPIIDEALHVLALTNPEQPGYTPEKAALFAGAVTDVWKAADRAAARYLKFRDRGGDVVFVSDHGMRAIQRSISVNELLRARGHLVAEVNGTRVSVAKTSPVDALASGGTAFVYVNRGPAEEGGLPPDEAAELVATVKKELLDFRDDLGRRVFAVVATREEAGALGLDSPNAGDLVLVSAGGTSLRSNLRADERLPLFQVPEIYGQHGFDPDPALDGIFFHVGDGISPERIPALPALDVAARISRRLGVEPPR
ncbi:MAG: alkaline phosphatase family protein [Acidobacteria bacterium]|nr:alkaline phosphatase family protein [Acidobacteriota bacterium]